MKLLIKQEERPPHPEANILTIEDRDIDIETVPIPVANPTNGADTDRPKQRFNQHTGNIRLLIAFSVVVIADTRQNNDDDRDETAAILLSCVSLVIAIIKNCADLFNKTTTPAIEVFIALIFLILWSIGLIALTFSDDRIFFELSSGFFATWACLLVSGNYFFTTIGELKDEPGVISDGISGYFGIALILSICAVAAAALERNDDLNRVRAVVLMVFTVPAAVVVFIMCFLKLRQYSDPFYFMITVIALLTVSFLNVLISLLEEPYAPRLEIIGQPPQIEANGFFSVLGMFIIFSIVLWKAHTFILYYSADNADDDRNYSKNIQGRYIWLLLLFYSSIVVLAAASVECNNFDSCDGNNFIGPLVAISFLQMFSIPFVFCINRGNTDKGDLVIKKEPLDSYSGTTYLFEWLSAFIMLLLWVAVTSTFTFAISSPFNNASAGYFFIWLSTFYAANYVSAILPDFSLFSLGFCNWQPPNGMSKESNFGLGLVLFGTIVQIVAIVIALYQDINDEGIRGDDILTLILQGCILFVVLMFTFISPLTLGPWAILLSNILMSLTFLLLLVTTVYSNPFDTAQFGNGFFAAWICLYGAFDAHLNYEWEMPILED